MSLDMSCEYHVQQTLHVGNSVISCLKIASGISVALCLATVRLAHIISHKACLLGEDLHGSMPRSDIHTPLGTES